MAVRFVRQFDRRVDEVRAFWLVDIVVVRPDGGRVRIRRVAPVTSERAARAWEERVRDECVFTALPKEADLTFGEFVRVRWWPTYPTARGNRPSTRREKASHLNCHILPALGELPLGEVSVSVIDILASSLMRRGLSPKTVSNILTTLATVLRTAVSWGLLIHAPKVTLPRVAERPTTIYTPDEYERLLAAATSPADFAVLLFALRTGARAGEILALRWGDVDLATGVVVIRRSCTRGCEGPPKSGRARSVPLTALLRTTLGSLERRSPHVFTQANGGPLLLRHLHEALTRAAAGAGLPRHRVHDLRHSWATALASRATPLRQLMEWSGHADMRVLLRYVHPHVASARAISVLDEHERGSRVALLSAASE